MKIFLITDIHFGENTNYPNVGATDYVNQFGEQFKHYFPHLREEMEACDLVVNIGDFIHDENAEKDIETYKRALAFFAIHTPVKHVLGNHDSRNITREKWAELVGVNRSFYSFDLGGYHRVVLDGNRIERRDPFYIPEAQLVWLEEDTKNTTLPVVVYCHFPLDNQNMDNNYYFKDHPESSAIANRNFVRGIFERTKSVIAVFSGHTHFFHQQVVSGVLHTTVPSFSENNGNHEPNGTYAIATLDGNTVSVEIKKSKRV